MGESAQLHDARGRRLYVTPDERVRLLAVTAKGDRRVHTFTLAMAFTGARISEVLALTPERIDLDGGRIVYETAKQRRRGVWRAIPVPHEVLEKVDLVHGIREVQGRGGEAVTRPLWTWSRTTAWRHVKGAMESAEIRGPQATPKGLRHCFGVSAALSGKVALPLLQRWMGHSAMETTAIYMQLVGAEERAVMASMWGLAG